MSNESAITVYAGLVVNQLSSVAGGVSTIINYGSGAIRSRVLELETSKKRISDFRRHLELIIVNTRNKGGVFCQ